MANNRYTVACLGVLLMGANGCAQPKPAPPPVPPDPALQVTLQLPAGPIRQLDPTLLTVRVRDQHNHPLNDATVKIDLTMPDMDMGKNQIAPTFQGDGLYAGAGRFTMPGAWRATVTASRAGHRTTQSFPLHVK